jgi:hypothetical protein
MTPSQEFKKHMLALIQDVMEDADVWKTCLNCKHFDEPKELCSICVPSARPPARVITFGCPAFNEIDSEPVTHPKVPATVLPPTPKAPYNDVGDDIPF